MKYQLKLSGGETYIITEKEAQELLLGDKKGLVGINSLQGSVNMSFVTSIIPENKIDRSKMTRGVLHDGTVVVKRFGEWSDANNPDVFLDRTYYPEIAKDTVMTEEEYNKQKLLN